jgi:hypothetical protein
MMFMRTTLTLDDNILKSIKRQAAKEGRSFKDIVAEALRLGLGLMRGRDGSPGELRLTVVDGRGTLPGVRLDDRDVLFDIMDGRAL